MSKERDYVVVEDFAKYADIKTLKGVVQSLERESAEVLEELRAEIRKRTQEMLADAAEAGVDVAAAPKKPGRKLKTDKPTEPPPAATDETSVKFDAE